MHNHELAAQQDSHLMISGTSSFFTPLALQKSWQGAAVKLFVFQQGHFLPCLPEKWAQNLGCWYSPASGRGTHSQERHWKKALGKKSEEHCRAKKKKGGEMLLAKCLHSEVITL